MPITEAMLADALKEYLGDPPAGFKNYLACRYPQEKIDDFTDVHWVSGGTTKKLTLRIHKESPGGGRCLVMTMR